MGEGTITVTALLRAATAAEVSEGLERNPGSARLRERGWEPLWFEARVLDGGDEQGPAFSLVWADPGGPARWGAEEWRALALEGLDVGPDDVGRRAIDVQAS